MSTKPNILVTGFTMRCPNCGKGHLFVNPNPFSLSEMSKMYTGCGYCKVSFSTSEPGFYWGAMYVSYALTAGLVIFNLVWIHFFFGWDLWAIILPNIFLIVFLAPLNFRISRSFWLATNMRFFDKRQ